jgi:hypothetical protein
LDIHRSNVQARRQNWSVNSKISRRSIKSYFFVDNFFSSSGDEFNPDHHDALFTIPDTIKKHGTVGQVVKAGYKLKDRVIRPAQVGSVVHPSS